MLQFFKDYSNNYLDSIDDKRIKDIIYKRNNLEGNKKYTLEEIGKIYNITRERIRQLEAKYNYKLKKMLMDRERVSKSTEIITSRVKEERILPRETIIYLLEQNPELHDWEHYYFSLIDLDYYEEFDLILDKGITKISIKSTINRIKETLKTHIIPMDRRELFDKVNQDNYSDNALDILAKIAGASIYDSQGFVCYQLAIDRSWSAGSLAYLTLWENQRIMSTDEILIDINNRSKGNKKEFNLINQMAHMESIQDISINRWALSEWGLEPRHTKIVMEKVIRDNNKAMEISEIIKGVEDILPNVNIGSIKSYTHQKPYTRLSDGRVIMSEWKDKYEEYL